jgi:hypothetical protein
VSKEYAVADEVWHRVVQIVQEAMLTGVDCADIMRQIRLVEDGEKHLVLSEGYKEMVADNYAKMIIEVEEFRKAGAGTNIIMVDDPETKNN